jgi:hypothetical protein
VARTLFDRHPTRIAAEQRALGLAYLGAMRPDWDPDATAQRIVAVADRRTIAVALDALHRSRRAHDSVTAARAEMVLRRAWDMVGPVDGVPFAS